MQENSITELVEKAWKQPFTTRCDYARTNAELVAAASCEGFITVKNPNGTYMRRWHVTAKGLAFITNTFHHGD